MGPEASGVSVQYFSKLAEQKQGKCSKLFGPETCGSFLARRDAPGPCAEKRWVWARPKGLKEESYQKGVLAPSDGALAFWPFGPYNRLSNGTCAHTRLVTHHATHAIRSYPKSQRGEVR